MRLNQKLHVLKLPLILLMLSGCEQFPKRPSGYLYNMDAMNEVAYELRVPDSPRDSFEYTGKDKPLPEMDKYYCISPEYFLELKFWAQDVEKWAKDKCE